MKVEPTEANREIYKIIAEIARRIVEDGRYKAYCDKAARRAKAI